MLLSIFSKKLSWYFVHYIRSGFFLVLKGHVTVSLWVKTPNLWWYNLTSLPAHSFGFVFCVLSVQLDFTRTFPHFPTIRVRENLNFRNFFYQNFLLFVVKYCKLVTADWHTVEGNGILPYLLKLRREFDFIYAFLRLGLILTLKIFDLC